MYKYGKIFKEISLILLGVFLISGCGGETSAEKSAVSSLSTPDEVVVTFLTALQNLDMETALDCVAADMEDESETEFYDVILDDSLWSEDDREIYEATFQNLEFENPVVESEQDQEAVVSFMLTSLDVDALVARFMETVLPIAMAEVFSDSFADETEDAINEGAIDDLLFDLMNSTDAEKKRTETILNLTKTQDGWKIVPDDELPSVIFATSFE